MVRPNKTKPDGRSLWPPPAAEDNSPHACMTQTTQVLGSNPGRARQRFFLAYDRIGVLNSNALTRCLVLLSGVYRPTQDADPRQLFTVLHLLCVYCRRLEDPVHRAVEDAASKDLLKHLVNRWQLLDGPRRRLKIVPSFT
jgi:hypothetical protein